jgi:hypothetical protein
MKLIILISIILVLVLFYFNKSKFGQSNSTDNDLKKDTIVLPTKIQIAKENAEISVNKQQALLDSANAFKIKALENQKNVNELPSTIPNKQDLVAKSNKTVANATTAVINATESLDIAIKQLNLIK